MIYQGVFDDGKLTDSQGTIVFPDGTRYKGSVVNNIRDGSGIESYPNKTIYRGQFKQGVKDDSKGMLIFD